MFEKIATDLEGVFIILPQRFQDHRGTFVKTFHQDLFGGWGIDFTMREEFFSTSSSGVVRGMHFQVPPQDHAKIVYCTQGAVLDVVLDIRTTSPTYGRCIHLELSASNQKMLFIPRGFAHGFLSLADDSLMVYKTDRVHSPQCDAGIRWNGFGFEWPVASPILSERDLQFRSFAEFDSPF